MVDVFFSYSSADRDRVRPIVEAISKFGFNVFWDQEIPAGTTWDQLIRSKMAEAKCAIVAWSVHSAASDNVFHEAVMAREEGKLLPIMLEPLKASQFPTGMYTVQAVNFAGWSGDLEHEAWTSLIEKLVEQSSPPWVRRYLNSFDIKVELIGAKLQNSENMVSAQKRQLAEDARELLEMRRDRDEAKEERENAERLQQQADAELKASKKNLHELMERHAGASQVNDEAKRAIEMLRGEIAAHEVKLEALAAIRADLTKKFATAEKARENTQKKLDILAELIDELPNSLFYYTPHSSPATPLAVGEFQEAEKKARAGNLDYAVQLANSITDDGWGKDTVAQAEWRLRAAVAQHKQAPRWQQYPAHPQEHGAYDLGSYGLPQELPKPLQGYPHSQPFPPQPRYAPESGAPTSAPSQSPRRTEAPRAAAPVVAPSKAPEQAFPPQPGYAPQSGAATAAPSLSPRRAEAPRAAAPVAAPSKAPEQGRQHFQQPTYEGWPGPPQGYAHQGYDSPYPGYQQGYPAQSQLPGDAQQQNYADFDFEPEEEPPRQSLLGRLGALLNRK